MAEVITRLKVDNSGYDQKIKSAQRSLDQFGLKGTEVGQKMSGLTQMLNVNIGALSKWSVGLAAAGTALKVAGDAMKSNETVMDEWGRMQESSKALYDGFLNALNTGDISGYVSSMNDIVNAARAAYNALDELGTFNAFNQINTEKARTGLAEALAGYRTGDFTKEQVQQAAAEMKAQLVERQRMERDAYEKMVQELAAKRGVDAGMLMDAMSGTYGDYKTLKETQMTGTRMETKSAGMAGSYSYEVKFAQTEQEKLGEMLRNLTDAELESLQALGTQAQRTATEVAQVDKQTARVFSQSGTKTEKKGLTMEQDVALTNREVLGMLDRPREGKGYVSVLEEEEDTYKEMYPLLLARRQAIDDINAKIAEMNNVLAMSTDAGTKAWATDQLKAYEAELDKLNGVMDETGEKMNNFQTGFSAVQNIWGGFANSVDMVSNCINTMTDAAEGNASAWQVVSSVIDTSFGVMNAVIGIMETINTLTELSSSLKIKNTAETIAETTAEAALATSQGVATGTTTAQAATNAALAETSMIAAQGLIAEANAATAAAHAAIPFAGPALAAEGMATITAAYTTAITAALAATQAMHFAEGGMVPGAYNGGRDTVPAVLSPGEIVLNRAQQNNLAGQLAGSASTQTVVVTGRISGKDILLAADNTNRSRGGSRGYYAKTR